jgi:hypothetical protein
MCHASGMAWDNELMKLATDNKQFRDLINLVHEANNSVLTHLQASKRSKVYNESLSYTPTYLKECFTAIKTFCTDDKEQILDAQKQLEQAIAKANKNYGDKVLSKDRSTATKVAIGLLKSLIIAVKALFTFDVNVIKNTYNTRFFKTASEKKLNSVEKEIQNVILPEVDGTTNK